jgi:hypothetical protein
MGKYGTDLTGFGAYEGDVNADNGATLVSTNSDGEKSLLLGPAASGEVLSNVANGNFEVLPQDPSSAISEENPLPYFTVTDSSSGRIVATSEPSTLAVGQSILRFTLTDAVDDDELIFSRYVPMPTSEARSFGAQFRVACIAATASANYRVRISAQYVLADQVTTTGTEATVEYTGTTMNTFIGSLGTFGAEIHRNPNGNGSAPADAAFLLIKFGIVATGDVASATFDISETRIDLSRIQYMMGDQTNPGDYGYAATFLNEGVAKFVSNELGPIGSRPELQLNARSGNIFLNTTRQGYTISLTSASRTASTVTIVTTRAHGFSTGYEVVVAGITGAAGTTMNGTYIITVTDTTTFTYTAAGTAGSGTVTSATVKAGPGSGIIYLQPAATAAGRVQVDGDLVIDGDNSEWISRITNTAAQSLTNNTSTKITFNTASATPTTGSYDPQGWFDNANDQITVGQDGFYTVSANIAFAANAVGRRTLTIAVNGADAGSVNVLAAPVASTILSVSTNLYLAAGDLVSMFCLQQSGGALNTVAVAGVYPALSVGRIGA